MSSSPPQSATLSVPQLRTVFDGRVISPDDAEYDAARTIFYGGFDRRPAVVIRPAGAADVSRAVTLARETGLELAVRSGGHSPAGHGVSDGGIVLDLSEMRGLEIDPVGRTAWAETGLTTGEYTVAAAAHGLATPFGDTATVGIGGITLSGGVGFLVRKYGLTIDSLLAADVVTADGELLRVDSETHPDLFWAIRGGGGNFGVATRFQFRLYPLDSIVGGMLILPATPGVIAGLMAKLGEAPEELSAIVNVMVAPPMPFMPPEVHGKLVVLSLMVYAGDNDTGSEAMAPFRALATPLVDMVRPMTYPEMYPPEEGEFHPVAVGRNMFVDAIDEDAAAAILDRIQASSAAMAVTQLRVLGGAVDRVPAEATAYAHRNRPIMVNVAAIDESPDQAVAHQAWVDDLARALGGDDGAYVGFVGDEGPERVRQVYPGSTWDRLEAIKGRYDPTNLFRLNQNIPPAR